MGRSTVPVSTRGKSGVNMFVHKKPQLMEGLESFKWIIKGFSKLTANKIYSKVFYLGGVGWRLIIYPRGKLTGNHEKGKELSIYLELADLESQTWCKAGSVDAHFTIEVVNQIHDKLALKKGNKERFILYAHQQLTRREEFGSASFMLLARLNDLENAYLVNDTCIIEVIIKVIHPVLSNKRTETPSRTQSHKRKKNSLDFLNEPPSKREGSCAPRVLDADIPNSKVTQSEEPLKKIDVSSNQKSPAKGDVVIEENPRSKPLPTLGNVLAEIKSCDFENQKLQFSLGKSVQEPLQLRGDLKKAKEKVKVADEFCAANVLDAIKSRNLEIQKLQLSLRQSAEEASQLRGDLEKVVDEKVKVADEFSAAQEKIVNLEGELDKVEGEFSASKEKIINLEGELDKVEDGFSASKEKIINLEGELQLLRSENVDLQIQLEDARQAEGNAAMRAVEDFKESSEYRNELRAMAFDSLKLATEHTCSHLKNKLPGFEPSMLDNLAKVANAFLPKGRQMLHPKI